MRWWHVVLMAMAICLPSRVWTQQTGTVGELNVPDSERTVPYVPTPPEVVEKMLEMAKVGPNDVLYDLGSGDGRIVIAAAEKYHARAVGVELDEGRFKESSERIVQLGLEKRAKIIRGNFFETDLRPATVVTLYLLTSVNQRLRPRLEKELRPGTRVVSHDFQIESWKAEQIVPVTSSEGLSHTVYLYIMPQPPAANENKGSSEAKPSK
jgi:precorrin-6B methylase 2